MPDKPIALLSVNELAKLHTLSLKEFNKQKNHIVSHVKKQTDIAKLIRELIKYCQQYKQTLPDEALQQTRFIDIIVAIGEYNPDIFSADLLEALGQEAVQKTVRLIYRESGIQDKKTKKNDFSRSRRALSMLDKINHAASTIIPSQESLPYIQKNKLSKKRTVSRLIEFDLLAETDVVSPKKTQSSPSFRVSFVNLQDESIDRSNSSGKKKRRSASDKSIPVLSDRNAMDFPPKSEWLSLAEYTKRAINSIQYYIPDAQAKKAPAATPLPLFFQAETQTIQAIFSLDEASLLPFQQESTLFLNEENALKQAMLKSLNIDTIEEAEKDSLIKTKCQEKLSILTGKWNNLSQQFGEKQLKISFFANQTAKVQQEIEQRLALIRTLKAEATERYALFSKTWNDFEKQHFLDCPQSITDQRHTALEEARINYNVFLDTANRREAKLQTQLDQLIIYSKTLMQKENLAESTYTALQSIYQDKIAAFKPNIKFVEDAGLKLAQISQIIAALSDPSSQTENLENHKTNTLLEMRTATVEIETANFLFSDLKQNKLLSIDEKKAYENDLIQLQNKQPVLEQSARKLLEQISVLRDRALHYQLAHDEAQQHSLPDSIQSLTTEIAKTTLYDEVVKKKTLQSATSGQLNTLQKKAADLLSNAQILLANLQKQLAECSAEKNPAFVAALTEYNQQLAAFNQQKNRVNIYLELVTERENNQDAQIETERRKQEENKKARLQADLAKKQCQEKQKKLNRIEELKKALLAKSSIQVSQPIADAKTTDEEMNASVEISVIETSDEHFLNALPELEKTLTENIAILEQTNSALKKEKIATTSIIDTMCGTYAQSARYTSKALVSEIISVTNKIAELKEVSNSVAMHFQTIKNALDAKSLLLKKNEEICQSVNRLPAIDLSTNDEVVEKRLILLAEKNQEVDALAEKNARYIKEVSDDIHAFLTNGYIESYVNSDNNVEESDPMQTLNEVRQNISRKIINLNTIADEEIKNNQLAIIRLKNRNLVAHRAYLVQQIMDTQTARNQAPPAIDSVAEQKTRTQITHDTDIFKQRLMAAFEKVRTSDYLTDKEKANFFKTLKNIQKPLSAHAENNKPKTTLKDTATAWKTHCQESEKILSALLLELQSPIKLERVEKIEDEISLNISEYTSKFAQTQKTHASAFEDANATLSKALTQLDNIAGTAEEKGVIACSGVINQTINRNRTFFAFVKNKLRQTLWGLFRISPIVAGAVAGSVIGLSIASIPGAIVGGIVGGFSAVIGETLFGSVARKLAGTEAKRAAKTAYENKLATSLTELQLIDKPSNQLHEQPSSHVADSQTHHKLRNKSPESPSQASLQGKFRSNNSSPKEEVTFSRAFLPDGGEVPSLIETIRQANEHKPETPANSQITKNHHLHFSHNHERVIKMHDIDCDLEEEQDNALQKN